ncbi:hypothetical protein BOTBODRAFT_58014 [Botryobasidium botryosum FD-172 SS1]|uniref:Major facilitator superfamily (MFS) profile domain-containing protein n=1 Tax=Botryobasidium botryosum (strain FD-172 SS1) TaxID=930990 RepID=A0A067M4I7_BOTB1|nr:hypothetical protein BOTBODRAFT_58014 [Botryobasidium botryosum FD-172 SS1]
MTEADVNLQYATAVSKSASFLERLYHDLGLHTLLNSPRDTKILFLHRFVRLFAYGQSALILALHFNLLGIDDAHKGLFMTMALLGHLFFTFVLALVADAFGRRKLLAVGATFMAGAGITFALASNYWALLIAAILGVIGPSGNEVYPFRAIEESIIAQLTPAKVRSDIFGWYVLTGSLAIALGSLTCGWIVHRLHTVYEWDLLSAYRVIYWLYTGLGCIKLLLSVILSEECEANPTGPHSRHCDAEQRPLLVERCPPPPAAPRRWIPELSPESKHVLIRLVFLLALDSMASGIANMSWITYYFAKTFSLDQSILGSIFFTINIVAAFGSLMAVPISRRFGLIRTMVFGHLPSGILLAFIPVFPGLAPAVAFLILRSSFAQMDTAPRNAFISGSVLSSERTAVMGIVNVAKACAQSVGPLIAGWLASTNHFGAFFVLAGCMKATYDVLVYVVFAGMKTDREGVPI